MVYGIDLFRTQKRRSSAVRATIKNDMPGHTLNEVDMDTHDEEVEKKIREADEKERNQWRHIRRFGFVVWVVVVGLLIIYLPRSA